MAHIVIEIIFVSKRNIIVGKSRKGRLMRMEWVYVEAIVQSVDGKCASFMNGMGK